MPEAQKRKYWFPAKRCGWGWGFPCTWQGWVVLLAYLVLVFGGGPCIQATGGDGAFFACFAVLTLALVGICWLTGEPPRWRSRDRDP